MKPSTSGAAIWAIAAALAAPLTANAAEFSGTRSNISPGGVAGGRCGDSALTILFAPGAFAAAGTSNLGNFSYTASHCIAGFPPRPYTDGQFVWDFGDGTLVGTYTGTLTAGAAPGTFNVSENIVFTGGTGRFLGSTGSATALGTVSFGQFQGMPASFGEATFTGSLVPEPTSAALLLGGLGLLAARRRRAAGARLTA